MLPQGLFKARRLGGAVGPCSHCLKKERKKYIYPVLGGCHLDSDIYYLGVSVSPSVNEDLRCMWIKNVNSKLLSIALS